MNNENKDTVSKFHPKVSLSQGEKKLVKFLRGRSWYLHMIGAIWGINPGRIHEACAEFATWIPNAEDTAEVFHALEMAPESMFKSMAINEFLKSWPGVIRTNLV